MSGIDERPKKNVDGIVEVFTHRSRLCVIIKHSTFGFHNGYVEVLDRNRGVGYSEFASLVTTDELTYSGKIEDCRIAGYMWFFGFDSGHYWNNEQPESKTFASVKERTRALADEFITRSI